MLQSLAITNKYVTSFLNLSEDNNSLTSKEMYRISVVSGVWSRAVEYNIIEQRVYYEMFYLLWSDGYICELYCEVEIGDK